MRKKALEADGRNIQRGEQPDSRIEHRLSKDVIHKGIKIEDQDGKDDGERSKKIDNKVRGKNKIRNEAKQEKS